MATMLPIVRYEGTLWFFDARLRQIRNIRNPSDFEDLDDFEMAYFEDLVARGRIVKPETCGWGSSSTGN